MITFLCAAVCQGCRAPVNVWKHGDYTVVRDRSGVQSPVHLCPPELCERIEIGFQEMLAFECYRCGSLDVAPTSWGRVVDFPCCDLEMEGWAEAWVGPLQEHVCGPKTPQVQQQVVSQPRYRTVDA